MSPKNVIPKRKSAIVNEKPVTRKDASPKPPPVAVVPAATVKSLQKISVKRSPTRSRSLSVKSKETVGRSPIRPTKLQTKLQKLPSLHYDIVIKILDFAEAKNLETQSLITLRSIGTAWRLAIDTFHLPFSSDPASFWSPYLSDKVPDDALAHSPVKCFKFTQDIQIFHELCKHPHNPFPSRELKIWCQASELPPLDQFSSSFRFVGSHLWSLTYVIGPSLESVTLLFDMLCKLPYLEDLRVIEAHPEDIINEHNNLKQNSKTVLLPTFNLSSTPPHRVSCLSVTGSRHPYILDQLLEAYGRGITLASLEMQGGAVRNSPLLKRERTNPNNFYLSNIQRLKICGGVDNILDIFSDFGWNFLLTHASLSINRRAGSPILSEKLTTWLGETDCLAELYLYFDYLNEIEGTELGEDGAVATVPKVSIDRGTLDSITKLGLPYKFVELNCWRIYNCMDVEEIEFHDWSNTVNKARRDASAVKFQDEEKAEILSKLSLSRYKILHWLRKITVYFGKSDKNSVTIWKDELRGSYYDNDDDDNDDED